MTVIKKFAYSVERRKKGNSENDDDNDENVDNTPTVIPAERLNCFENVSIQLCIKVVARQPGEERGRHLDFFDSDPAEATPMVVWKVGAAVAGTRGRRHGGHRLRFA